MTTKNPPVFTPCQEAAFALLRSGKNVFLTGAAGVGKSWLLSEWLRELSAQNKKYSVTASSGIAAMLVGGRTLHSYLRVGLAKEDIDTILQLRSNSSSYEVRSLNVLIIDEISMLSGEFFTKVEAICRHDRRNDRPWGGVQLVVVGDGGQLPPVEGGMVFTTQAWKAARFIPALLKTQVRTTDQEFANTLMELRSEGLTPRVWDLLDSRYLPDPDPTWIRLYPRRADADRWNTQQLYALSPTPRQYPCIDVGHPNVLKGIKSAMPVPEKLLLARDAYVMFRVNTPLWVNGSTGYVRDMRSDSLEIEMADVRGNPTGVTYDVRRHEFGWQRHTGESLSDAVKQFPVQLAWGVTIHKCQGATLDRVAVDLRRLWEPGQAYVALSRVRTMEGLAVMGWTDDSFQVDPFIVAMYNKIEALHDQRTELLTRSVSPGSHRSAACAEEGGGEEVGGGLDPRQVAILASALQDSAWGIPDIECPVRIRSLPQEPSSPGEDHGSS